MTQPSNSQSPNFPISQSTNPYVGPRTFTEREGRFFFGREREARDLTARIVSERLLLFYAQSGAGKSSLLHARVIPRLRDEERFQVLPVGRVSGELPAGAGAVEDIYAFNLMTSLHQGDDQAAQLARVTLSDFLARLTRETVSAADGQRSWRWVYKPEMAVTRPAAGAAQTAPGPRFVLIIDQFEELITGHPDRWREREDFFRQLNQALLDDPNLWAVLTLREDYVAALDPYAELTFNRLRARFYMERMGKDAALDAIRHPAELGGRPFAPGVAEKLADDLRQVRVPGQEATIAGQYVEPVQLQVVCYQLWENLAARSPLALAGRGAGGEGEGEITIAALAQAGNVDQALAAFYESAVASVVGQPALGVSEQQLRTWFSTKLITETGTRGTVFRNEQRGETAGLPNAAVDVLARQFLLRTELRAGGSWVELVHDRFVEPILRANRARQTPLALDAEAWLAARRNPDLCYEGQKLQDALQQIELQPDEHTEVEREFLRLSQQEQDRRKALRRRRLQVVFGALGALIAVLAIAALVSATAARQSSEVAELRRQEAVTSAADALTAEALARSERALALAQRGTAEAASTQAVAALATAQAANTAQVQAMQDLEAALQTNLTALALSATPPTATPLPTSLASPTEPPVTPTFALSPTPTVSGATPRPTATATPRPTAIAKRTSTPTPSSTSNPLVIAQQTQLAGVRATQTALAVALPSERILFVSNRDNSRGDIHIMQSDGKNVTRLTDTTAYEPSYTEASDGQIVYTSKPGERVSIYRSPVSRKSVINLTGFDSDNWEPTFSKNGQWIAFVSSRDLLDWEIYTMNSDGSGIRRLTNDDPARNTMPAWSPDDAQIAFITVEGCDRPTCPSALRVMASDGTDVRRLVYFRGKVIMYPAWSPDGQLIAFASDRDGNMDIFTTDASGTNLRNLTRSPSDENFPAWSLDGQWIAFTRYTDNTEIFIMTATGSRVTQMTNHPSSDWYPVWVR